MAKAIDLTGMRFGRWEVLGFSHRVKSMFYWNCRCDCGTERAVFGADLKRGGKPNGKRSGSLSCGCLMRELSAQRNFRHGMADHPAYRIWIGMKTRCERPGSTGYEDYGGRGISICPAWSTFEGFWRDMEQGWIAGLTIERRDVNGHYEPDNCYWATQKQQANNRRSNHRIDTPWGNLTVTEAAARAGILPITVFGRIRAGWSGPALLSKPDPHRSRPKRKAK